MPFFHGSAIGALQAQSWSCLISTCLPNPGLDASQTPSRLLSQMRGPKPHFSHGKSAVRAEAGHAFYRLIAGNAQAGHASAFAIGAFQLSSSLIVELDMSSVDIAASTLQHVIRLCSTGGSHLF